MQSIEREVLLLDVGNSAIKVGRTLKGKVEFLFALPTQKALKDRKELEEILKGRGEVAVASVVPELSKAIKEIFPKALFIENLQELPVKIGYKSSMGADRVANILGASTLFKSFIVASVGTAAVIDVVINRAFKGGAILPGPELMAEALKSKTALLPKVGGVREKVGKSTPECIKAGIFMGIKGAIKSLKGEFKGIPLILTGGGGDLFRESLGGIYIRELTLKGIFEFWKLKRGRELPQK